MSASIGRIHVSGGTGTQDAHDTHLVAGRTAKGVAAHDPVARAMAGRRWLPARRHVLLVSFLVLLVCQSFMMLDVIADVFYLDIYIPFFDHTLMETVAVFAMTVGMIIVGRIVWEQFRENRRYREAVGTASGRLLDVLNTKFEEWNLTPSEREVALLLIKGLSVSEIARIRNTRPGTIKSQSNAIYRKAGLKGRSELAAYFMEDLLAGDRLLVERR